MLSYRPDTLGARAGNSVCRPAGRILEAGISHRTRRFTILFLVILASDYIHAQDGDELLREFSQPQRAWIRRACADDGLFGPARFYTCLAGKADELRRSPGEPDLSEFSTAEQASLRRACSDDGLFGPGRFYSCLRQKAEELHVVRRQLGLSSQVADTPPKTSAASTSVEPAQAVPAPSTPPVAPAPTPALPSIPLSALTAFATVPVLSGNERLDERVVSPEAVQSMPAVQGIERSESTPNLFNSIGPSTPQESRIVTRTSVPSSLSSSRAPRQVPRDDNTGLLLGGPLAVGGLIWAVRRFRRSQPAPPAGASARRTAASPRRQQTIGRITFADPRTDILWSPHESDLTDVRDAVTGQPLHPALGLHRCTRCQVFYQASSVDCIQRDNGGRCISCGSASVVPLQRASAVEHDAAHDRQAITTLQDYRSRVDQVVVFEGRCVRVLSSRSGTAYAVMFEDAGWTEGFKLVIRTGFVTQVGGAAFIRGLAGRTIRARGVIEHSAVYGYEITVTARSMILGVW